MRVEQVVKIRREDVWVVSTYRFECGCVMTYTYLDSVDRTRLTHATLCGRPLQGGCERVIVEVHTYVAMLPFI